MVRHVRERDNTNFQEADKIKYRCHDVSTRERCVMLKVTRRMDRPSESVSSVHGAIRSVNTG